MLPPIKSYTTQNQTILILKSLIAYAFPGCDHISNTSCRVEVYHVFSLGMEVSLKVIVVLIPKQGVFKLRVMSSSMKTNFLSYNPLISIITHPRSLLLLYPL